MPPDPAPNSRPGRDQAAISPTPQDTSYAAHQPHYQSHNNNNNNNNNATAKSPRRGHRHNHKSKSRSPLRMRSLSPFGRQQNHGASEENAKKVNVMVCHQSAHAIVFRDLLRNGRRIIQEMDEEAEEHFDDSDYDSSDSDDEESGDDSAAAAAAAAAGGEEKVARIDSTDSNGKVHHHHHPGSSLRDSLRQLQVDTNTATTTAEQEGAIIKDTIVTEINHLAHELVPELKSVTVNLETLSSQRDVQLDIELEGLHAHITPLLELEWSASTKYEPLLLELELELQDDTNQTDWTDYEKQVYQALQTQQACVKTIQKQEWPSFLQRFQHAIPSRGRGAQRHADIPANASSSTPFTSFVTSTTLLPPNGQKMRCYGSDTSYPVGVVFLWPTFASPQQEEEAVTETETWAWPAGYAAKTEFNIDTRGQLINGRQQALEPMAKMRQYNQEYVSSGDHYIAGRIIKGGFNVVPYNEVFLRVGGPARSLDATTRSLDQGVGLFAALFVRTNTMLDIINLFRTRARIAHTLGMEHVSNMPLLYLHHEHGIRVFTRTMQQQFWKEAALRLQPWINPSLQPTVRFEDTNDKSLEQKLQEQLWLDDHDDIRDDDEEEEGTSNNNYDKSLLQTLTHHESAKIAGGFGVTDASFLKLLRQQPDFQHVHDILQEGFAGAIRSNDYYTARQLLILYSLSNTYYAGDSSTLESGGIIQDMLKVLEGHPASSYSNHGSVLHDKHAKIVKLPSPLATKRLRRAVRLFVHWRFCALFSLSSLVHTDQLSLSFLRVAD